jgi:transcriptional antiterminator NusG
MMDSDANLGEQTQIFGMVEDSELVQEENEEIVKDEYVGQTGISQVDHSEITTDENSDLFSNVTDTAVDAALHAADNELEFEESELEENKTNYQQSPYDRPGNWYVVHTYAGYEKKVKSNLETRRESLQMADKIYEIVIPMEDAVEVKSGKKYTVSRKVFPGYILVRSDDDSEAFEVIRRTPGVTGFVGAGNTPSRLSKNEVETILKVREDQDSKLRSKAKLIYEIGQTVRVKEGPFADFSGQIAEINEDQLKLQVLVNIFGRETPVELEFSQVVKL